MASGRIPVAEPTVVFTVKLPAALAFRIREHARESGDALSAVVAAALADHLGRGRVRPGHR
ncbi:hypothetical protein [Nocardia africana]|uniref:hypothetical protein n=1 Tax=Nocardia africana TaxID=134964 RepID=UPI001C3FD7E4|nr:hypothetical protein [Nocardia africana]MCC3317832.1 hypothetical protein [Nocardia africana]